MKRNLVVTHKQMQMQNAHYDRCMQGVLCPTCGREPNNRTFDHTKKVWIYKHSSRRNGVTKTIYHESVT